MSMRPGLRKFALTAHVVSSVGWLGAVTGFLALAIAGIVSADPQLTRAVYPAMELVGWFVIVPLAFMSLLSGIIQSLGTDWGLFRHYWVLIKLIITVVAMLLLVVHMQVVRQVATAATQTSFAHSHLREPRIQLVADAAAALLVLLVATVLAIYKPRGLTPYGLRKQREQLPASGA